MSWYNPFVIWLLRSPLHRLLDGGTMLITVTRRRSGALLTTPVNYLREGDVLWVTSRRDRKWWRNVREGAPVTVHLGGRDVPGTAVVAETPQAVIDDLTHYLGQVPQYARYFEVRLDSEGRLNSEDVVRAAQSRIVVKVQLN